jgi:hypothetical protein
MDTYVEAVQGNDKYIEGVQVLLGRSARVEAFVAIGALATAVLVALLPMDLELQVPAIAWIAGSSLAALRGARPGRRLRLDSRRGVEVGEVPGVLRGGSFVAPWLVVVRWRPAGAWMDRNLLVAPDMLGGDDFRRLRVLLRWA